MSSSNEQKLLFHLASHTNQLKQLTELLAQSDTDSELFKQLTACMNELIKSNDQLINEVLGGDNFLDFRIETPHKDDLTIHL